jgi:hypothetical protein
MRLPKETCFVNIHSMDKKPRKFHWHANANSGGTLSLSLHYENSVSKKEKEMALAHGLEECLKFMENQGYIPFSAQLMSSRDIANKYGKTRQYWEKLLNEGRILYKETAAGRITTDLWMNGYLGNKEDVDKYVKDVREVLDTINKTDKKNGTVHCAVCKENRFEFYVNLNSGTNGICRVCGFHVYTVN